MKNLNLTRIRQLWGRLARYNRKSLIIYFVALVFGMYLINLTCISSDSSAKVYLEFYFVFFWIYGAICLSGTFETMNTPGKRINFLCLPAAKPEKFTALTTWTVVSALLLFAVAMGVCDLFRALTVSLADIEGENKADTWLLPQLYKELSVTGNRIDSDLARAYTSFACMLHVFFGSLFILGSSLWYKKVFLKTVAVIGSAALLLFIIVRFVYNIMEKAGMSTELFDYMLFISEANTPGTLMTYNLLFAIGTVLAWMAAYRVFCRREVISQKRGRLKWLQK